MLALGGSSAALELSMQGCSPSAQARLSYRWARPAATQAETWPHRIYMLWSLLLDAGNVCLLAC